MSSGQQDYYYQPEDGYMFPKPYKGQSLISYLESRSYDTGAELDKVKMHFCGLSILVSCCNLSEGAGLDKKYVNQSKFVHQLSHFEERISVRMS